MNAFGYTSKKEAKDLGFTHEGSMYGIPIWLGGDIENNPVITVKHCLAEWALDFVEAMQALVGNETFEIKIKGTL